MTDEKKMGNKIWEKAKKVLLFVPLLIGGIFAYLFFKNKNSVSVVNQDDFVTTEKDEDSTSNIPESQELEDSIEEIKDIMK